MREEYKRVRTQIAKKYCGGGRKIGMILADRILAVPGVRIEADEQTLPKDPHEEVMKRRLYGDAREDAGTYKRSQRDMRGAGFVRCIPKEEL